LASDTRLFAAVFVFAAAIVARPAQAQIATSSFSAAGSSEAIATLTATCDMCAWDVASREAVFLTLSLDGRYIQHLPLVRTGRADYRVMLGRVEQGRHALTVEEDKQLTSSQLREGAPVRMDAIRVDLVGTDKPDFTAISFAPILYARPDTVGKYTDAPVFMWYEVEPTSRGTRYRYSVIFTNEDGGTPADRLMATWGRTTDIEYVYSVELDSLGNVLSDDIQGPKHEILLFKGRREGSHPLLWVSTDNNMVLPEGATSVRYAPAPVPFDLQHVSREEVMDAHPWLYGVMASELKREAKIADDPPPGQGTIPDLRRFVFVEGCGELADKALAFSLRVGDQWISSDRGVSEYRIARNGCFRAAVPLPSGSTLQDVRSVRAQVFARGSRANTTPARLTRINAIFTLDEHFVPQRANFRWQGEAQLQPDAEPFEIALR
jgi:hypothetical protein